MTIRSRVIALDFDGTCVAHEYPRIGRYIGAQPVLQELVAAGHLLVLNTVRSRKGYDFLGPNPLQDAIDWFKAENIPIWGVNRNPEQHQWTYSPKVDAELFIDDRSLGIPLCRGLAGERPYVDWKAVRGLLVQMGYLPDAELAATFEPQDVTYIALEKHYEQVDPDTLGIETKVLAISHFDGTMVWVKNSDKFVQASKQDLILLKTHLRQSYAQMNHRSSLPTP